MSGKCQIRVAAALQCSAIITGAHLIAGAIQADSQEALDTLSAAHEKILQEYTKIGDCQENACAHFDTRYARCGVITPTPSSTY